ncbi:MAG: HAMP domain-containing histidine kinase [Campylobacterales bacterium]|nr:HAMP domain-containing histidine kinase [Campylobacterales bacterium]
MIRSSIFYSITFIFFLSTASIFLAFLWLMEYDKQNYTSELNTKYSIVARATLFHLNNFITNEELEAQVNDFKMTEISDAEEKQAIIENAQVIEEIQAKIGNSSILIYNKNHYLKITHNNTILLLKDEDYQPYRYDVIRIIFASVFLILLATYIFTIRKLKPLRKLKQEIDKFARGDLEEVTCNSTGSDEISEVALAFYNAVGQIKALNQSRQLFLRNIMHELKTPITKGRITAEMVTQEKYKTRLITVFEKLETLINEFASIERITSGIGLSDVTGYRLVDLIDEAMDLAMAEPESVQRNISEEIILHVDFKLFSIALKNMIDNGIKYSKEKRVKVVADSSSIRFISLGDPLEHPFEHYLEPFVQGANSTKSLGLGLYIVDNIIKAHALTLTYRHQNGYNVFYFEKLEALIENSVQ